MMINKLINKISFWFVGFSILFLASCHGGHHTGIKEKITELEEHAPEVTISTEQYNEGYTKMKVTDGEHHFLIPTRESEITLFACSECHSKPMNEMISKDSLKKAHWNITLNHANKNAMQCSTCHNKAEDDALSSITQQSISFNESYKLCSQCHQGEYKDWLGGAHGKRRGGWAKPRVNNTCVNCHNPHDPKFKQKMPVRLRTVSRE